MLTFIAAADPLLDPGADPGVDSRVHLRQPDHRSAGPTGQSRDATLRRPRGRSASVSTSRSLVRSTSNWASDFVRGEWGESFVSRRSVGTIIKTRFWATIQLIVWGILVSLLIAVSIGVYSALRQYSFLDYTFTGFCVSRRCPCPPSSSPCSAIQFFVFQIKQKFNLSEPILFSVGQARRDKMRGRSTTYAISILPVLTLSVQLIASWSRYQRSSMLDVSQRRLHPHGQGQGPPAPHGGGQARACATRSSRSPRSSPSTSVRCSAGSSSPRRSSRWPGMGDLFLDIASAPVTPPCSCRG